MLTKTHVNVVFVFFFVNWNRPFEWAKNYSCKSCRVFSSALKVFSSFSKPTLSLPSPQRIKSVAAPAKSGVSSRPKEYSLKGSELTQPLDPNGNNGLIKPTHTIVETTMWVLSVRGIKMTCFLSYFSIFLSRLLTGLGFYCPTYSP